MVTARKVGKRSGIYLKATGLKAIFSLTALVITTFPHTQPSKHPHSFLFSSPPPFPSPHQSRIHQVQLRDVTFIGIGSILCSASLHLSREEQFKAMKKGQLHYGCPDLRVASPPRALWTGLRGQGRAVLQGCYRPLAGKYARNWIN